MNSFNQYVSKIDMNPWQINMPKITLEANA